MTRAGGTMALAVALAVGAAQAEAVMCVKKSGAVFSRAACKKHESVLGPEVVNGTDGTDGTDGAPGADGAQGLQGPQGPQGPQGAQGDPGDFQLVDATGRAVGILDIGHPSYVAVKVPGAVLRFTGVQPTGFDQDSTVVISYEGNNCTGPALLEGDPGDFMRDPIVYVDAVYYAIPPIVTRTVRSQEEPGVCVPADRTARGFCCTAVGPVSEDVGTLGVLPLASLGTPPFSIR